MSEDIPQLPDFNESTLDAAFATLAEEVRTADTTDVEAFRLHWLGRKQGRLKLISEAWLKFAPPEAKKALGIRFNQLKQQIEAALEAPRRAEKFKRSRESTSPSPAPSALRASLTRS